MAPDAPKSHARATASSGNDRPRAKNSTFLQPWFYDPYRFMEDINESPDNVERSLDPVCRRDGWTPFARRVFLATLAETGRATRAAQYAGMSKQSAYNLRNRDAVFAAGWDAASHLARQPMADEFAEQSMD